MSNVTIELIQQLRTRTGVGIGDCKKALIQTNGDIEKAVDALRQKGVAVAAKRSDNATENGLIQGFKSEKGSSIIEISCETDFSARTEFMKTFSVLASKTAAENIFSNIDDLLNTTSADNKLTIQENLNELVSKICENIKISKATSFKNSAESICNIYIHPDHTVGSMLEITANKSLSADEKQKLESFAKDLCMQIAVTNPLAIHYSELPAETLTREKETAEALAKQSGKTENFWAKIIEGKLRKYYEEVCLLNQKFIKDDSMTVEQKLMKLGKELNIEDLKISNFVRFGIKR